MTTQERFEELAAKDLLAADTDIEELRWLAEVVGLRAAAMVQRAERLHVEAAALKQVGVDLQRRVALAARQQERHRGKAADSDR